MSEIIEAKTPEAEQEIRDRTPDCNEPEPDLVRYRCNKPKGHLGPHSWQ